MTGGMAMNNQHNDTLRPCLAMSEDGAWFHQWYYVQGEEDPRAIVEFVDGTVATFKMEEIQFIRDIQVGDGDE
jgi:hypothetical protein